MRRNPSGRGHFSPLLCRSSLRDTWYLSLLTSRNEKKWLPAPLVPIGRYTLGPSQHIGNLCWQRKGIERLHQHRLNAKIGKPRAVVRLHLRR